MPRMTARRHHYVPQCYLRGFLRHVEKPKLYVVDRKTRKSFCTTTENIAVERDFHTIVVEGRRPDDLENAFSEFESEVTSAIAKIRRDRAFDDRDVRAHVLNFMALLTVKNPRFRRLMHNFQQEVMKSVLQLATATPERWEHQVKRAKRDGAITHAELVSYESVRDFVERDQFTIREPNTRILLREIDAQEAVLPTFFRRNWVLLCAPAKTTGFVTSDHPVCLTWSHPDAKGPVGHGLAGTEVLFPLCNELALVGALELEDDVIEASPDMVSRANSTIIASADRQVYAQDDRFTYIGVRDDRPVQGINLPRDNMIWPVERPAPRGRRHGRSTTNG